jgi:GMP synthase-like glutamine amidotransferase
MKAHCFQHEPFEGMGAIESWLKKKKFDISYTRFFETDQLPQVQSIDWLILMGGSMSVNDEQELPWLVKEKAFIKECIRQGKVVIGICLGAQLIASALGAKVYKNVQKEIGWFPIWKVNRDSTDLFSDWPEELIVYHWHGETFDLPSGSKLIASSEACQNQIFILGDAKVIGFQCHPETTTESLSSLTDGCRVELVSESYIQKEEDMIHDEKKYSKIMHQTLFSLLDRVCL